MSSNPALRLRWYGRMRQVVASSTVLAIGGCSAEGLKDTRMGGASDTPAARVFTESFISHRFTGWPTERGSGAPVSIPETLSAKQVQEILDIPMPKPSEVAAGVQAREMIERESKLRVIWILGGPPAPDEERPLEQISYAELYETSVRRDEYASGVTPRVRSLGDLLGTWLDMAMIEGYCVDRVPAMQHMTQFGLAIMITPVAVQFVPIPLETAEQ